MLIIEILYKEVNHAKKIIMHLVQVGLYKHVVDQLRMATCLGASLSTLGSQGKAVPLPF